MALHSEHRRRERILVTGSYGAGKTKGWVDIHNRSGSKFYVCDTDRTVEAFEDRIDFSKVVTEECTNWQKTATFLEKVIPEGSREDWLVIDSIDKPWQYVQDFYSRSTQGEGVANRWLAHKTSGHIQRDTDWQGINAVFAEYILNPLTEWTGHIYLCAAADTIQREGRMADSKDAIEIFGRFGVKPRGNKFIPNLMHTILVVSQGVTDWKINTIKDRERKQLQGASYGDFVPTYLIPVAGWKL